MGIPMLTAAGIVTIMSLGAMAADAPDPQAGWHFAFRDFVIAAWAPPPATEGDYALVKQAHFNLVMSPRYPLPDAALDLAQKHGLKVMVDTYTPNDKPWGGTASAYTPHPSHHPATLPELKWLHERYGQHPALAGYLLGDDYGKLPPELLETVNFLRQNAPHLFPWICQNDFRPESLVQAGQPLADPQLYPTLYQAQAPVEAQCALLCDALDRLRRACNQFHLISWPMFNITGVESDSLIRFQPYACLAYGAQGIWYFTYDCLMKRQPNQPPTPTPAYEVVRDVNARVEAWGPELLGRRSVRVLSTGLEVEDALAPAKGLLVWSADKDLLIGILVKDGADTCAMVVDSRAALGAGDAGKNARATRQERKVTVTFAPAVRSISTVAAPGTKESKVAGNSISLTLPAGGGQLVRLQGPGVPALAERLGAAVAATPDMPQLGPERLMAWWTLDESSGAVAHDRSGLGNDLKLTAPVWAAGKVGGALDLTSKGSAGNCVRARLPNTPAMSLEAWVKPKYPTAGPYGCVLNVGRGGVDRFEFGFGPDNIYPVITNGEEHSGGMLYVGGMKQRIPENTWGHIAIVAGPKGAATYVNGECVAKADFVGKFDFWRDRIELGARGGAEEYEGVVDEVRIWGRELTAEEVRAHAQGDR